MKHVTVLILFCLCLSLSGQRVTNPSEPSNANIQSHIANRANPHAVTAAQVGAEAIDAKIVRKNANNNVVLETALLGKYTAGAPVAGHTFLPAAALYPGFLATVVDCESTSACTVGGGSVVGLLRSNGAAWSLYGYKVLVAADIPAVPLVAGTGGALSGVNELYICTAQCTVMHPAPAAATNFAFVMGRACKRSSLLRRSAGCSTRRPTLRPMGR